MDRLDMFMWTLTDWISVTWLSMTSRMVFFIFGAPSTLATFSATELVIANTAFEILEVCTFPNVTSLTVSEEKHPNEDPDSIEHISDTQNCELLFSKIPNLKHLTVLQAFLTMETRYTIFERIKLAPYLETVDITFRLSEALADMEYPIEETYLNQLVTLVPNLSQFELLFREEPDNFLAYSLV